MNERLTLQDLIDVLAEKRNITKKDAETFLRELVALISETISNKDFVRIKDFGTLKLVAVSARKSVDVNTGEAIEISPHYKLSFTPDKVLRELVNRPFSHFESVLLNEDVDFEDLMALNENVPNKLDDNDDEEDENDTIKKEDSSNINNGFLNPVIETLTPDKQKQDSEIISITEELNANTHEVDTKMEVNFEELDLLQTNTIVMDNSTEEVFVEKEIAQEIILVDKPIADEISDKEDIIVVTATDNSEIETITTEIAENPGYFEEKEIPVQRGIESESEKETIAVAKITDLEKPEKGYSSIDTDDDLYDFLEESKRSKKRNIIFIVACACILVFGSVGYWIYTNSSSSVSDVQIAQNNDQITITDEEVTDNKNDDSNANGDNAKLDDAQLVVATDKTVNENSLPKESTNKKEEPLNNIDKNANNVPKDTSVSAEKSKKVTLEKGETMRVLGQKYFGNPVFWVYIFEENSAKIKNPDAIYAGMEIMIPPASKYGIDPKNKQAVSEALKKQNQLFAKFAK